MFNYYPQLQCQNEGHENANIIGVCTDSDCKFKRPYCLGCKFQFHHSHQNQLRKFEDLKNWVNENSIITKNLEKILNELQEVVNLIQKSMTSTQEYVNSNFHQMQYTTLDDTINNMIKLWKNQKEILLHLEQMMQSQTSQTTISNIKAFSQNQQFQQLNIQQQPQLIHRYPIVSNPIPVQAHFQNKQQCFKVENMAQFQQQQNGEKQTFDPFKYCPNPFNQNQQEYQKKLSPFKKQFPQNQQQFDQSANMQVPKFLMKKEQS